jgi:hypothetical protein
MVRQPEKGPAMNLISIRMRIVAAALAGAVSGALLLAVVGGMPPDAGAAPDAARNTRGGESVEFAAVPFRIEVIGTRSEGTAVAGAPAVRPGS